jgi:hypothetical protein
MSDRQLKDDIPALEAYIKRRMCEMAREKGFTEADLRFWNLLPELPEKEAVADAD